MELSAGAMRLVVGPLESVQKIGDSESQEQILSPIIMLWMEYPNDPPNPPCYMFSSCVIIRTGG